jgi:hypothetical protein
MREVIPTPVPGLDPQSGERQHGTLTSEAGASNI